MNGPGNGRCCVDKDAGHDTYYKINADENGNSPLTEEGAENEGSYKEFKCFELEVYQIWL